MKTIKLSILFLVQILLLSCSEQVYVDGTSKQVIKRYKMITQAISQLTPQNKLLVEEINKNVQDTILERLNMNIAGRWNDSSLSLTLMKSTIKFVPVIEKRYLEFQKSLLVFMGRMIMGKQYIFMLYIMLKTL